MGYDNLGLEYLGKTKQEIEEIEARKDKSFRQVLEPIGNTINFIGDALDTVDKEAGIPGTDIDVYHARQLLSVQPARQLGQELGKSTGLPYAEAVGGAAGTMIAEVFTPDTLDLATAIPTLGTGVVLNRLANIPRAFNVGLDTYRAINKAQRAVDTVTTGTKQLAKTLFPPQYQPAFASVLGNAVDNDYDVLLSNNIFKAELLPPPVRTGEVLSGISNRKIGAPFLKKQQNLLKTAEQIKASRKSFTQVYNIATQGPLKHHHKFDQYLGARVANRTDSPRLFEMLEAEEGIELGDMGRNIIGLADQKTYLKRTSGMESVIKQLGWGEIPKAGTAERRLLDDLFKELDDTQGVTDILQPGERLISVNKGYDIRVGADGKLPTNAKGLQKVKPEYVIPGDPASYGLPRGKATGTNTWDIGTWPDGSEVTPAQLKAAFDNRFAYNKIDKSKIKYDRGGTIVSGDHIDLTHYTGIDSKDFTQRTELINLLESGEHLKLSTRQLKDKVTEVYRIQENIAVNVAIRRMNFIKDYVKNSGKIPTATRDMLLRDPNKLRQWIVNNPGISGNIGWKLKKPTFKELSKTPSSRHLKEWRDGQSPLQIVFGKGAAISRPKDWVPPVVPATTRQLNRFQRGVNQNRL